ncbi:MAG: hypothetical protein OXR66_06215 [Candidatus Woesearchaeota archaeon]|nr:hypothetical protein [Candidatus Woesearchaeota archaeon]
MASTETFKEQLAAEQDITDWSVKLQRASRKERVTALKQQGLL